MICTTASMADTRVSELFRGSSMAVRRRTRTVQVADRGIRPSSGNGPMQQVILSVSYLFASCLARIGGRVRAQVSSPWSWSWQPLGAGALVAVVWAWVVSGLQVMASATRGEIAWARMRSWEQAPGE